MALESSFSDLIQTTSLGSEAGFDAEEAPREARISGYIALVLGLAGSFAIIGFVGGIIALFAIAFGLYSQRAPKNVDSQKVNINQFRGVRSGQWGLVLGGLFAAIGIGQPYLKWNDLGGEAIEFTRVYIDLIEQNKIMLMDRLARPHLQREPLEAGKIVADERDLERLTEKVIVSENFQPLVQQVGGSENWELDRPVRVYNDRGTDRAEVVWRAKSDATKLLQFFLVYEVDVDDQAQWFIETTQPYREMIISESIL
ncbi:MAG: hypothetical protein AAF664_10745 [Planctomycetota bacterium]